MKWLPVWLVDCLLLCMAWFMFGNTDRYGIKRPLMGPLELKNKAGKTPVLDVGAMDKIRNGRIKVFFTCIIRIPIFL
jgi:indole-3-pyruvate monooxygenase